MLRRCVLPSLVLCACASGEPAAPPAGSLRIEAAPLSLVGVDRVCYDIVVRAGPDATSPIVWSQSDVCSDQFGNAAGGDITYIGTCDASLETNRVEVTMTTLWADGAMLDDWVQPPPFIDPEVPCEENVDTLVAVNFTVMRRAEQGFLDIAVDFEDIFCSAKVDCQTGEDGLLHAGADRADTLILAFSCYDRGGATPYLMMDDIVIECDRPVGGDEEEVPAGGWPPLTVIVEPSQSPGRFPDYLDHTGITFGAQGFEGVMGVGGGSGSYWSIAVGMNPIVAESCVVTTRFTATKSDIAGDLTNTTFTHYPMIDVNVVLDQGFACDNFGLDEQGSESFVATYYLVREQTSGTDPVSPETVEPVVPLIGEGDGGDSPPKAFEDPFSHCFDPTSTEDHTRICERELDDARPAAALPAERRDDP